MQYHKITHELPTTDKSIANKSDDPSYSQTNFEFPKFSLGFQHFIHQSLIAFHKLIKQFDNKKKIYYVVNNFEVTVDEHTPTMKTAAEKFFGESITERSFYKIYELIFDNKLIPLTPEFKSMNLSGDGALQATILYRKTFAKQHTKDTYYTLSPTKLKHKQITETKKLDMSVDLVIADANYEWTVDVKQEQETNKLFLTNIINALKCQAKNGNFICKIYESFTLVTVKLLCCLTALYKHVHVIKPLTSRSSKSERYIVCVNYVGDSKLEGKLQHILTNYKQTYLTDIFPDYDISDDIRDVMKKINTEIGNKQYTAMNVMMTFINEQNYLGETYSEKRSQQIAANEYWIKTYLK